MWTVGRVNQQEVVLHQQSTAVGGYTSSSATFTILLHCSPSLVNWPVMSNCMLKVQSSLESTKVVYYRANAKISYTHGLVGTYVIYRSKVQICSISTVNSSRRVYILFSHIHHSPSLYMYSLLGWPIMSNCMMKVNDTCRAH